MKLRNFAARTQKSYLAAMVGLAKHYRQYPAQLKQEQIRIYVLELQEPGTVEQFAEREYVGATVFLSTGFRMEPFEA
jgi:hypothetical protein